MLHQALVALRPTLGARIALAAVLGRARLPLAGLVLLDALPAARMSAYQPFWAVRAHLLAMMGDEAAVDCYWRAAGLSQDPAVRAWLLAKAARLRI